MTAPDPRTAQHPETAQQPTTSRRALVVMPSLSRGGAERHSVWLATQPDRNRWETSVLAFTGGPLEDELRARGVPVEILSDAGAEHGLRSLPTLVGAVRSTLDRVRPDLVTGQNVVVDLAVRRALRGRPVPYLVWKHTYGHIGHRGLRERVIEKITGGVVTRYGAVCHTQVRYLTDELGLSPAKIAVLPNSVPLPTTPTPRPAGPPTVLMVAAMRADKDHASVLQAWPLVLAAVPDARLVLAGDGPCRPALEAQIAASGIGGSVDVLGVRGDVDALLAGCSLLVLASYAVECFPYAVLEAMAAGRGVVSTDVAGLPEMVDDGVTGRLVPPRDARALAGALIEGLADDGAVARRWGAAGRDRAAAVFDFAAWGSGVENLYDRVLSSSVYEPDPVGSV